MGINERTLVSPIKVIIRVVVALLLIAIQVFIYWLLFVGSLQLPYIYLVSWILSIILIIKLYNSNDNISYKILWIVIMLLFNTGPLLYLCFGNGSNLPRRKHKKISGYLQNEIENKDYKLITIPFSAITKTVIDTYNKYYTAMIKMMKLPINTEYIVIEDMSNTENIDIMINNINKEAAFANSAHISAKSAAISYAAFQSILNKH